ncbi:MAG: alpha-1,2-fucosyltransferase [Agathobacter sp.]
MVIVKVMGGIGNQLFQYAFARSIEMKYNYKVKFDFSYFQNVPEGNTKREAFITHWVKTADMAAQEEVEALFSQDRRLLNRIKKKFGRYHKRSFYEGSDITEKNPHIEDPSYLIGYWQSEKYFKEIETEIRRTISFEEWELSPKEQSIKKLIQDSEYPVSMHVRAGDYLLAHNQEIYGGICTPEYYRKAYEEVLKKHPEAKLFVFTNDVEWTREHIKLPRDKTVIVSEELKESKDWVELYLMSLCKSNILANSSYSWWAGWLNNNTEKKVYCPPIWDHQENGVSTICDDWIRID